MATRRTDSTDPAPPASRWRTLWARRPVRWLAEGLLLLAVVVGVSLWQTRDLLGDGPAPPLALATLDGGTLDLGDLRGRTVALAFWAPWCPVCGAEMSNLAAIASDDVAVVSVALEYGSRAEVERFVREHDVAPPVLLGNEAVRQAFRVTTFPTVYVIDDEGHIEDVVVGYTTTFGLWWRTRL